MGHTVAKSSLPEIWTIPLKAEGVPQTGAKINPLMFAKTRLGLVHSVECSFQGAPVKTTLLTPTWGDSDEKWVVVSVFPRGQTAQSMSESLSCFAYNEDRSRRYVINVEDPGRLRYADGDLCPAKTSRCVIGVVESHPSTTWRNNGSAVRNDATKSNGDA